MSGVKRYMHISPLCEAAPLLMENYPMATEYVLASDYDRDTQELKAEIADLIEARDNRVHQRLAVIDSLETERDALRAHVEAMRELLRKVAPHFAAPPGLGYLHADIDAALQDNP